MSIIAERAGAVHVRVGGNTQDTAYVVESLPNGKFLDKDKEDESNPVRPDASTHANESITHSDATDIYSNRCYHGRPHLYVGQRFQPCPCKVVLG